MTARVPFWIAGLAVSAAVHVAIIAVLTVSVEPDPVPEQTMPSSEFDVQAYQLDRTQAAERRPDSETPDAADASGSSLSAGAIPRAQATAIAPPAAALDSADVPAVPLEATASDGPAVTASRPDATRPEQVRRNTEIRDVQPTTAAVSAVPVPASDPLDDVARATPIAAVALPVNAARAAPVPPTDALASIETAPPALPQVRPATNVVAAVLQSAPVLAQVQPAQSVPQAAKPSAVSLASVATPQPTLPQVRPQEIIAVTAAPVAVTLAVVKTTQPTLAQAQPAMVVGTQIAAPVQAAMPVVSDPASLPETVPTPADAPQATPVAQATPQAVANAQKLKAALAFSGGAGDEVDPVSLAAFQSFVRPGDIQASGDTLRDGVSALLAQVPCSRLQVGFDPDTATLQVKGHIPEADLRAPVLAALQTQMGADITVSDNILILPRPQCGALSGIADVGLPQSTDQITNPLVIGQDAHVRVLEFVKNDRLYFDITAPDYDAWVYVDYFDADGNVLHLSPNEQVPIHLSAADSALRIGTKQAGDAGLQLLIGPPYGQEITVAFAASEPLYAGLRPIIEPAAPYLEWLKARVAAARDEHDGFKGEWVYFFVTTAEN